MHTQTSATQITHTDLGEERRVGSFRGFGTSLGEHRQTIRVLASIPLIQEGSSFPSSPSCSSASQTFQGRKDPVDRLLAYIPFSTHLTSASVSHLWNGDHYSGVTAS